jgi:hypothetical protein
MATLATHTDWKAVDSDAILKSVIKDPHRAARRFQGFLNRGGSPLMTRPKPFIVDRSKSQFDLENRVYGEYAVGNTDRRSTVLTKFDFTRVVWKRGSELEPLRNGTLTHATFLLRSPYVVLDAEVGAMLFKEDDNGTLRFIADAYGHTDIVFAGTLLGRGEERAFLLLRESTEGDGNWVLTYFPFTEKFDDRIVFPAVAL